MRVRSLVLAAGACLLAAGCGAGGAGGGGLNANMISRAQMDEHGPASVYEMVQAIRPTWLQKRGQTSFFNEGDVQVYLDGTNVGGPEALRGMHSDNVESIQYLDERRASYRFGPGHEHGAILVTTRR